MLSGFYQHHTESNRYRCRLQITPQFSSLKQLIILQFLCIQDLALFSWALRFRGSSQGCNQGISQSWGLMWKLAWGRAPKLICVVLAESRSLRLIGLRTSVSVCWRKASPNLLPQEPLKGAVFFIKTSKTVCVLTKAESYLLTLPPPQPFSYSID